MKLFGGNGHNSDRQPSGSEAYRDRRPVQEPRRPGQDAGRPAPRPQPRKKKKGKGWLVALLVILLLAAVAFAYYKITTKPPKTTPPDVAGNTGQEGSSYEEVRYYTLMVVGDDQEGGNTDTIMVIRLDTVEMKANVVSIPRDTMVNSTLGNKKINAVYHNLGGVESLLDYVEQVAGFRPNNYVVVDTDVFVKVVDAMGGVDFYVPFDMDYDDWSDHDDDGVYEYEFHIHVKEGQQTLNGYDALGVFRWRQNTGGKGHTYANPDIDRISMQHNLLMAIVEKAMSTRNIITLMNIATSVLDNCETDLDMGNIQWYGEKLLKMSMEDISFHTMPVTGTNVMSNALNSYVTIDPDKWIDMVNSTLNPYERPITKEQCTILYPSKVELVNGQYYAEIEDIVSTDGTPVDQNFNIY